MERYTDRFPKFTAEASLLSSKNARDSPIYNPRAYYSHINALTVAERHIDPRTWCNHCDDCDPVTHTQTCEMWRGDIQDCVGYTKRCTPTFSCSCNHGTYKTESDCLRAGYAWCCLNNKTGISSCVIHLGVGYGYIICVLGCLTIPWPFNGDACRAEYIKRIRALDGTNLELVAWGLRNAYGLGFLPDGRLIATDQGADDRGSRPVGNAHDLLFQIRKDSWYGWPDFIGAEPITDAKYKPERGPQPSFLLANHGELHAVERPLMRFPPHSAAVKFDAAPAWVPEWKGQIFVALFGDERPMTIRS